MTRRAVVPWQAVVATPGARLRAVGGEVLLFVAASQAVYAPCAVTAALWPAFERGVCRDELAAHDGGGADALRVAEDLIGQGALRPLRAADEMLSPVRSRVVSIADVHIAVHFGGQACRAMLEPMLEHFATPPGPAQAHVLVFEAGDDVGFATLGEEITWCDLREGAPVFRAYLTDCALSHMAGVAIHAASLVRDGEALLLLGGPGAGKSTLALALADHGFSLAGDDLAVLGESGRVRPVAFPATVKDGSWALLPARREALAAQPAFVRPDGNTVRYLPVDGRPGGRLPAVRHIVRLDRSPGGGTTVEPIGPVEMLAGLFEGAFSRDRRLTPSRFEAFAACVDGAQGRRLRYQEANEAAQLLARALSPDQPTERRFERVGEA